MEMMRQFDLMRQFDWQLWAMGGLLVFIGIMIGIMIACWDRKPSRRKRAACQEAPVPYMAPRQSRRGETVEICGATWYRMN